MKKNVNKRSSKNLKVNTRIILTTVLAILIPLIIIITFSSVFVSVIPSYFNFSSVTTKTYSAVNQIQWSQTLTSLTNELYKDSDDDQKLHDIENFASPLENFDSLIYIERDGEAFYSTKNGGDIMAKAKLLVDFDTNKNLNYFGSNGMLIVNHAKESDSAPQYTIVILNNDYIVNDVSDNIITSLLNNLLLGRTGLIAFVIVLLFIIAITVISFITTQTIVKPIKKISYGADEIARGNLDYEIDYESTNELGQTVDSFNDMRRRLKESIEKQNKVEDERKILVAGIAHDLRTPLTSAKGYAEGLIDGIADTPEKQQRYLKTICNSINDTEKILDDLLTVSRLEIKGYELDKASVSAKEFFDDGAQEIKLTLTQADIDFEYENLCDENTLICIDTDRFARVINNIISNSIKYSRDDIKGKVCLKLEEYEHSIIIEISDNGIGVEQKSLAKIFDTMYRTDPARTKVSQGSGLGLSICKQIVELHSGSIWARSRNGEGLSIFISLPKKEEFLNEQNFNH